jgi:hypothetical protein
MSKDHFSCMPFRRAAVAGWAVIATFVVICFGQATDEMSYNYTTVTENATSYSGTIVASNPNSKYAWNGSYFDILNVGFQTTSKVTAMGSDNGTVTFTQSGNSVWVNLGWQSTCSLGVKVNLTVTATKQGNQVYPQNFTTDYVRGRDILYPDYGTLPVSWTKGKANLTASDLIDDPVSYYDSVAKPVTATLIMYKPSHPTQIQIGQVDSVPYPVNTANGVKIWIPGRLMAMGVAVNYEFFKINPNYMVALGTKENFAAGLVPASAGNMVNPIVINGVTWYWPMVAHPDGPYQQETENFSDCMSFFPDLFPPNAVHDNYTSITIDTTNPDWISAAVSSAISITVTREYLNAIYNGYNNFMDSTADPWAELSIVDYAYNRGTGDFLNYKLFTANRAKAIASKDIVADFSMGGFADHTQTVRAITDTINKALKNIYDARISMADMNVLFDRLRMFYGRGVPSDSQWNAMKADVGNAFNMLAQHWGKSTVSYRYDFLTLLRVVKEYLPQPYNPRPTGSNWYYQVINNTIATAVKNPVVPSRSRPADFSVLFDGKRLVLQFPLSWVNSEAEARLYSSAGKLLAKARLGNVPQIAKIVWSPAGFLNVKQTSGLYFVRVRVGAGESTAKVLLR